MSTESKLTLDAFAGLLAPVEAPTPELAPEAVPATAEQETSPAEPAVDAPIATKSRKPSRAKNRMLRSQRLTLQRRSRRRRLQPPGERPRAPTRIGL